ncbi:squalene--hopene cyclase [Lichenihabitans sp. Uapishka_5]|uniref:squalene--hopene cyclase n=1 Tax=Lichenihabitans sp. Uapishka_5 TaxID=3037302 RepID=UPI0029E7FB8E|nr:squalene--hopene cyclase [Lichenihabitans sp. Uapishka_5]MDX7951953.1 squalene--hopene cyclase [Lichenihabitans sp. Uapishka_5]
MLSLQPDTLQAVAFASPSRSSALHSAIDRAVAALTDRQQPDGHFVFDLEADAAIPAEYILLKHYLGERDPVREQQGAAYLRRTQEDHGGWPMLARGRLNLSASVKAYLALKAVGDSPDAPHMVRARAAILAAGGAAHVNMFTRITLALFGLVPWRAVPVMPVELMHAPRWFPVHLYRMSYWARTTLAPLLVLMALKPQARNPERVTIDELFPVPPFAIRHWPKGANQRGLWGHLFGGLDRLLRAAEPLFPKATRRSAIDKAVSFIRERLNGDSGLGAIFPPMAFTVMMFDALGWPADHPEVATARRALELLVTGSDAEAFCQPCVSPVWDTALSAHGLMEAVSPDDGRARAGLDWLAARQVLDVAGDWAVQRPGLRPGGWGFQYSNPHYPDLDDTAVIVMAMDRARGQDGDTRYDNTIARAAEWIIGMQSRNGGWGAYDADNTATYLNAIPFADHGALLDPPTSDLTARCISMLAQLGHRPATSAPLRRGLAFLMREQHPEGSWFGRWGVNYIYGTWSVLCALNAAGLEPSDPAIARAIAWLERIQNSDGGWGEDDAGYELDYKAYQPSPSTASQTAWALLGLMAAGGVDSPAVARGTAYLVAQQCSDGFWPEERFTGVGFPRVFYLRYDGYPKFFPLWALARYRNLKHGNAASVMLGM